MSAEIKQVYGLSGDDLPANGERIAGFYRIGETPSRAALEIGAEFSLLPSC